MLGELGHSFSARQSSATPKQLRQIANNGPARGRVSSTVPRDSLLLKGAPTGGLPHQIAFDK
jgi:hypothetical protein